MSGLQTALIHCPYCGESITVMVDGSIERQEYIEDCAVCCRPIIISVEISQGEIASIEGRTEND